MKILKLKNQKQGVKKMKQTGIVRRIDDLGRVIIPKEIRRVFRIQEGDPLEIFVTNEGILLKKYSPIAALDDFAHEYAESLHESTHHTVMISDKDRIISVSGGSKKQYLDKEIGDLILHSMETRKKQFTNEPGVYQVCIQEENYSSYVIVPIVVHGDPVGAVALISKDENVKMGDIEMKLAETAATFLAKQME
jgi:AbrB family transcriptional regulator (stage V sporulation protein T)